MILYKKTNYKGADQTARMCRLVCACVVHKPPKTGFLTSRPKLYDIVKSYNLLLKKQMNKQQQQQQHK